MSAQMTMGDFADTVTGFDEIAISQNFGKDIYSLLETNPSMGARALVFVAKRREGLKDKEAKQAVMSMPMGEVNNFFAEEVEADLDEDNPDTPLGEGDSLPG